MDFFIGNPFSTRVGQLVDQATRSSLPSSDWNLNMDICDIINNSEEGPKDAVRAIKKKIVGNRNFKEVMLTLTVLETCVKNCGHKLHVLVSTREFVDTVLVRTYLPKNEPPFVIQEKVLRIIQAWADAFRSFPDLTGVVYVYEDLRKRGVNFPKADVNSLVHNPGRRLSGLIYGPPLSSTVQTQSPQQTSPLQTTEGPITLSSDQEEKLRTDLEHVYNNLRVMLDVINQANPKRVQQSDTELLKQLYTTSKKMQERIVNLVPRLADEKQIKKMLDANDDINAAFTKYHSFETLCNRQSTEQVWPTDDLIDLNPAPPLLNQPQQAAPTSQIVRSLSSQMACLSTNVDNSSQRKKQPTEVLQERNSLEPSVLNEFAAASAHTGLIPVNQNDVMNNIEQWLDEDLQEDDQEDDDETNEAFDKFLLQRVRAAERLPSVKESSSDHMPSQ
ncbi:target of Myb protein 1 [Trichomycterus rosablanca]|uniref:target of Myb protein 1 n=1 Tax=Trichomycterus rosablanca TaxID=2290929 RepID=UPI002F34F0FA